MFHTKEDKQQLILFANNALGAHDALAVAVIANTGPMSGGAVGAACGRGHSWLGTRLAKINEVLAQVDAEIGLQEQSGRGYVARLRHPVQPASAPATVEQPLADVPAPAKKPAYFCQGPYMVKICNVISVAPHALKERVNIGLKMGSGMFIPSKDPDTLAQSLIDACPRKGTFSHGPYLVRLSSVTNVTIDAWKKRVNIGFGDGGMFIPADDPEAVATALNNACAGASEA